MRISDAHGSQRVSSTPPHGGDSGRRLAAKGSASFNPRLRMEATAGGHEVTPMGRGFNPRLRMGGDGSSRVGPERVRRFNPRLRMGGDLIVTTNLSEAQVFQSTPPHGRRPYPPATVGLAPSFNPRLRMGGDDHNQRHTIEPQSVSIHASAWEATQLEGVRGGTTPFQSTPPHGRRQHPQSLQDSCFQFQSTPPHGRRRGRLAPIPGGRSFNPRLRMGGDLGRIEGQSSWSSFNPRLRMGGDLRC